MFSLFTLLQQRGHPYGPSYCLFIPIPLAASADCWGMHGCGLLWGLSFKQQPMVAKRLPTPGLDEENSLVFFIPAYLHGGQVQCDLSARSRSIKVSRSFAIVFMDILDAMVSVLSCFFFF